MKRLAVVQVGALALAVAAWTANRAGWLGVAPAALAALAAVIIVVSAAQCAWAAWRLRSGLAPRTTAWAIANAGICLVLGGGLVNWLWGVQGFVVLVEGDVAPVSAATLDGWAGGPFADPGRLGLSIRLDRVELAGAGGGYFRPVSKVALLRRDAAPESQQVAVGAPGSFRSLHLHQGAFGFAPKIRIEKAHQGIVFDQWVLFRTERRGAAEVGFAGKAEVPAEGLTVRGQISLDSLDGWMRGHPTLELQVEKGGQPLGSGTLAPGRFAEVGSDYRIGLVGVRKWSELDVASRSLRAPVLAGLALLLAAAVVALASLRRGR